MCFAKCTESRRAKQLRHEDVGRRADQNPPVRHNRDHRAKGRIALEALSICATPAILVACTLTNADQTALLSLVVVLRIARRVLCNIRIFDIASTRHHADGGPSRACRSRANHIRPHPGFQAGKRHCHHCRCVPGRKKRVHGGRIAALASNFFFGQGHGPHGKCTHGAS